MTSQLVDAPTISTWQPYAYTTADGQQLAMQVVKGTAEELFVQFDCPLLDGGSGSDQHPVLTMYLAKQPDLNEHRLRDLVEKGAWSFNLGYALPEELIRHLKRVFGVASIRPIYHEKTTIQLFDRHYRKEWACEQATGLSPTFQFKMSLSAGQCAIVHRMLKGDAQALMLHIKRELIDPLKQARYIEEEQVPLRALLTSNTPVDTPIRFLYFDPSEEAYLPLAKRMLLNGRKARAGKPDKISLVGNGNGLQSTTSFLRPTGFASPTHMVATNRIQMTGEFVMLDAWMPAQQSETSIKSLPIIEREKAPLWLDRRVSNQRWYLPVFNIATPDLAVSAAESPFRFRFERVGTGADGQPTLIGEILLTIKPTPSNKTAAAIADLDNDINALPVPLERVDYALILPYKDDEGNDQESRLPPQEILPLPNGQVELRFRLSNLWIRGAYSAFSAYNDMGESPKIKLAYTFRAYRRERTQQFTLGGGTKISNLVTHSYAAAVYPAPLRIDVASRKLSSVAGEIQLGQRPLRRSRNEAAALPKPLNLQMQAVTATAGQPNRLNMLQAQPAITLNQDRLQLMTKLVERVIGKEQELTIDFPCATFAKFYVEASDKEVSDVVIGCREPYTLGILPPKRYNELPELEDAAYRVLISTQSLGRFLVIPTRYTITRKWSEPDQLYRPAAYLHTTVDAVNDYQTIGHFDAALAPDIPAYKLQALKRRLREDYSPNPQLEFPTQVDGTLNASFNIAALEPVVVQLNEMGEGFDFNIRLALADLTIFMEKLRQGQVNGECELVLPDGTEFSMLINLDPANVAGPWLNGPVLTEPTNGALRLVSQVNNTLSITAIRLMEDGIAPIEYLLGIDLAAGESKVQQIDTQGKEVAVIFTEQPPEPSSSIEETQLYLDDIKRQIFVQTDYDLVEENVHQIVVEVKLDIPGTAPQTIVLTPTSSGKEVFFSLPFTSLTSVQTASYRTDTFLGDGTLEPISTDWQTTSINSLILISRPAN